MDGRKGYGWMEEGRKERKGGSEEEKKEGRNTGREREKKRKRLIYYKELAHAIMEPEKSKICGVGGRLETQESQPVAQMKKAVCWRIPSCSGKPVFLLYLGHRENTCKN